VVTVTFFQNCLTIFKKLYKVLLETAKALYLIVLPLELAVGRSDTAPFFCGCEPLKISSLPTGGYENERHY